MKRVVITGAGIICSTASSVEEFNASMLAGLSGEQEIPEKRFKTIDRIYRNRNAHILNQDYYDSLRDKDFIVLREFCCDIIEQAITDAKWSSFDFDPHELGFTLGTSVGTNFVLLDWGKEYMEGKKTFPSLITTATIAGYIRKRFNIQGPVSTISTACAAGTNSIGRAIDFIRNGKCSAVIAGGADIFTEHSFSGFNSLTAISKSKCRPFDKARDGMMLGDGGAFFVIEELEGALKRGANIKCEILGYSTLNEAYHPTSPRPDGSTAVRVMREAIMYSGIQPSDIEYINAHGTATAANDSMEWKAINTLFNKNRKVYVSAIKSMVGHTLGAAGSIEILACMLGLQNGYIPPTINTNTLLEDTPENIEIIKNKALFTNYNYAISNSFGFAGNMASIVLKKYSNE